MPAFRLLLSVDDVDLVVDLDRPVPWSEAEKVVLRACGHPPRTRLYLGPSPVDPAWTVGLPPLLAGVRLSVRPGPAPAARRGWRLACVAGPDAGRWVDVGPGDTIRIGRGADADLRLDDPGLSRWSATLTWDGSGPSLRGSGHRPERPVPVGTPVRIGSSLLRLSETPPAEPARPDGRGHLLVARPPCLAKPFHHPLPPPPGPAPRPARRPLPVLAALLGGALGAGVAAVTGMWMFLLLAALGPLTMLGSAVADRASGRRSHRRAAADHRRATTADGDALACALRADAADAWDRYSDPATLLERAEGPGARLWERGPGHPEVGVLSLGWGRRPARIDRADPPELDGVPIVVDLREVRVLGLVGDARPLLRSLLGQLLALHAPGDVGLALVSTTDDLAALRYVPHLRAVDADTVVADAVADPVGAAVLVLDGPDWRERPSVRTWLSGAAAGRDGLLAICRAERPGDLPGECRAVVRVDGDRLALDGVGVGVAGVDALVTGVDQDHLSRLARALSARADRGDVAARLPGQVDLETVCGVAPDPDAVAAGWRRPRLTAGLGLGPAGPWRLDLPRDGPHLLVAGTTGAGKSELLRTLVLGLALSAPPDHTSLLLVDYKGGAAFGALVDLPHVTGVLTDLDGELAARALHSLRGELHRREATIATAGVADLAELRVDHPALAFASLVLVVDEFATLAAELPDFLGGLVDIAQRGRSLGIHLVLATQRPAGVLSPAVRANIGARICLRVTDPADSLDVLDDPGAARLPVTIPGRGLARIGGAPPVLFQTARPLTAATAIRGVRRADRPAPPDDDRPADPAPWVAAIAAAAVGRDRPRPAWRPPLAALVDADAVADDVLAVLDRPADGDQLPFSGSGGSLLVTGPPGSGRSATLRRWARGRLAPAGVGVGVGPVPAGIRSWPGVLTWLDLSEPALVQRLVDRLGRELARRRGGGSGPDVVVLVDGIDSVLAALEQLDYGTGGAALGELAASGPPFGIRVGAAADVRFAHHRIAGRFGDVISLGADERTAPAAHGPPGRGRIADHAAQVVWDPPERTPPACDPASIARAIDSGLRVRPLPELVHRSALPAATGRAVPVGVGGDDAGPVSLDLSGAATAVLVAGPRRSGVSTTLRVLAEGAAAAGIPTVRLDWRPSRPGGACARSTSGQDRVRPKSC